MNFLSAVLIFEINVSNPSKKERKKKNKEKRFFKNIEGLEFI